MAIYMGGEKYVPGMYVKQKPDAAEMSHRLIGKWDRERLEWKKEGAPKEMPATICFARKIGVGALQIADILGERIGYRVIDREIMEYISNEAKLTQKTVAFFDERYPGRLNEFLSMAFGEKAFVKSDYAKQLLSAVLSMAYLSPTIFVGRGAHLILPRERILAVWFVASKSHRAKRLAAILNVKEKEAESRLNQIDKEQQDFFNKVFGTMGTSPDEFDMVINCDPIQKPEWAAEIVENAFKIKFGAELHS
ncbi:MAG: cytidylate kinase-like family protein [Pseudomonadota bacterium]